MADVANGEIRPKPGSLLELFWAFSSLAMQGFGGVLAVAQKELCDRRAWLTAEEFLNLLSTAQVLPGPNVCNLSLMIGDRFFGWRGALAALAGMITLPLLTLLCLAFALDQAQQWPGVQPSLKGALGGIAAVAAGQIIGTVLKLAAPLKSHPLGWPTAWFFAAIAFTMMAWLRWPLIWILLGVGFAVCLYTYAVLRHQAMRT